MAIHNRFAVLEAAAEAGDEWAKLGLTFIADSIGAAFDVREAMNRDGFALALDGADSCERVAEALAVWIEESNPLAFRLAEARANWPALMRDALAACELVGATNGAAILSEFAEGANRAHAAALAWQEDSQSRLARALGWLDSDGEPRVADDVPAFASLLAGGDASAAELRAFDPWHGSAVNLGRTLEEESSR